MTANPVFINELRQSAFRRRAPMIVVVGGVVGLLLALVAMFEDFRGLVVYAPLVLLPLVVPAIASGAFAKEYEQQTWMDLYLTRLTNAQVVWGKFGAYIGQICAALLFVLPACLVILWGEATRFTDYSQGSPGATLWPLYVLFILLTYGFKLIVSACLAIFLTMICSRYSPNRRTALIWSYIAMALYSLVGWLMWWQIGSLVYKIDLDTGNPSPGRWDWAHEAFNMPGFMQDLHVLFCFVIGVGSFVLLWVSLSEQRGYKASATDGGVTRAWQPIAKPRTTTPT